MITKYNKFNESLKDYLKPKSEEEINKSIEIVNKNVKEKDLPMANMITGCENGLISLVQNAIDNGVDIHFKDEIFLQMACYNNHIDIVKLLLDLGADPDVSDGYPYQISVARGSREVALLLAQYMKNK